MTNQRRQQAYLSQEGFSNDQKHQTKSMKAYKKKTTTPPKLIEFRQGFWHIFVRLGDVVGEFCFWFGGSFGEVWGIFWKVFEQFWGGFWRERNLLNKRFPPTP